MMISIMLFPLFWFICIVFLSVIFFFRKFYPKTLYTCNFIMLFRVKVIAFNNLNFIKLLERELMELIRIVEIIVLNLVALVSACQYCERSRGLYKYGAVYEKDIAEFAEYRG